MSLLKTIFTWWNNQTIGTWLWTVRKGEYVGSDDQGNKYYQTRDGERRWVIYNGVVEASRVPSDWHGWLHHTVDQPPSVEPPRKRAWQKEHRPNFTGTSKAYRPAGSLLAAGSRPHATGDYEAWQPED